MKKLSLLTAASCVLAIPVYAEDAPSNDQEPVVNVSVAEQVHEEDAIITTVNVDAEEANNAEPLAEAPQVEVAEVHWGYDGAGAAHHWGDLNSDYHACKDGKMQSPINIARFLQEDLPALDVAYQDSPLSVSNNGHSVQVNFESGSHVSVNGVQYNLLHTHFHTPSEHYLDGAPYPMEVHLVHQAADGTLAVIGVMMKVGEHNPVIEGIWQNVPPSGETKVVDMVQISPAALLPEGREYYKYEGSLTTPPCSEGVQWHVLKNTIEISADQLRAFQAVFPVNARPVQPLNGRVVTGD